MTEQQHHHGDHIAVAQQGSGGSPAAIYPSWLSPHYLS